MLLNAILVSIERLLPNQFGMCKDIYTVDRVSRPEVQCSVCLQGFHSTCLETAIGTSKLTLFPVKLHRLCDYCTPRYSLLTVVGEDGKTEKPRSKRG